jgi:transposase-like protein
MAKYDKKKLDEYEVIITNQCGLVTRIAEALKVTPKTIHKWRNDHEEFGEIFDRANEAVLDMAESQLFKNVKDGKEASIFFLLKCRGKARGYIEKEITQEVHIDGKDLRLAYDAMDGSVSST